MKNKFLKSITLIILAILITITSKEALAIGQITDPIIIKNALRGNYYEQTITVVNTENYENSVALIAEKEIEGWVKFYEDSKSSEEIKNITIPPKSQKKVIARFFIPQETPNGEYKGFISVKTTPKEDQNTSEESHSMVSQKIDREVTIEIGGEEIVDFDIYIIPDRFDYNKGDLIKIRILYENHSNISISPELELKIKTDNNTVYSAIYPFPENQNPIPPASIVEINSLEIPTSNFQSGRYSADFLISQGDKKIKKDFSFSLGLVKSESSIRVNKGSLNRTETLLAIVMVSLILILVLKKTKEIEKLR